MRFPPPFVKVKARQHPATTHMCPKDFVSNRNINDIFEEAPLIPINWNSASQRRAEI